MSTPERIEIAEEDAAKSLWRKYKKTPEYKSGNRYSISSVHPLVRESEEQGLADVILGFVRELERPVDIRVSLSMRKESDWIDDWKQMHNTLFRHVYRKTGELRPRASRRPLRRTRGRRPPSHSLRRRRGLQ